MAMRLRREVGKNEVGMTGEGLQLISYVYYSALGDHLYFSRT